MNPTTRRQNQLKWKKARILHKHILESSRKNGSMENALWRLSNNYCIPRGIFVQAIVGEFMFDSSKRVEDHLGSLYDCFVTCHPTAYGSDSANDDKVSSIKRRRGGVDWRLIYGTYLCILLSEIVLENPKRILLKLFDVFSNPERDSTISLQNASQILSIAAVTEEDYEHTAGRWQQTLSQISISHNDCNKYITKETFLNVLEVAPGIVIHYRDQLLDHIGNDARLRIFAKQEEKAVTAFQSHVRKLQLERSLFMWKHHVQLYFFQTWKEFTIIQERNRRNHLWMLYWSTQNYLHWWKRYTNVRKEYQTKRGIIYKMARRNTLQKFFAMWKKYCTVIHKVRRACAATDMNHKRIDAGLGHLRLLYRQYQKRVYFQIWFFRVYMEQCWEKACCFYKDLIMKRSFQALRQYAQQSINEWKREQDAQKQQKWLQQVFEEVDTHILQMKQQQIQQQEQKENEKILEESYIQHMVQQRNLAQTKAKDRYIREVQAEARKGRVDLQRLALLSSFEEEWDQKFHRMEQESHARVNKWLHQPASKEILQKELKILERDFFMPPSIETLEREQILSSLANICLSMMDGQLFHKGWLMDDFVDKLKAWNGSHHHHHHHHQFPSSNIELQDLCYITESFGIQIEKSMLRSLYIEITNQKHNNNDSKQANIENENYDSSSFCRVVDIEKLQRFINHSFQYNGVQGSPWKKYISPAHDIMLFHNVISNVQIMDYEMNSKILIDIVNANIRAKHLVKDRIQFRVEKAQSLKLIIEINAAKIIQTMYRNWIQRKVEYKRNFKLTLKKFKKQRNIQLS